MKQTTIQIGDRFGKLVVVSKEGKLPSKPRRIVFKCKCDCGNDKLIDAGNLKKPGPRSCGCERKRLAKEKGKRQRTEFSYFNLLYGNTKRSAKSRKLKFDLSKFEFNKLIRGRCYYCASEPMLRGLTRVGIEFPRNGIDRVNNNKGYTLKNCVTCCSICNTMKLNMKVTDFYIHISKIAQRQRCNIAKAKGWINEPYET